MLKIGITGGIGSGKTTVCQVFEVLGIPVFYADQEAKTLMLVNTEVRNALIETFGKNTYREDGSLNREFLAKLVFNDDESLIKLNQIVHPAVFNAFNEWAGKQSAPYVVKEAALLFESASYKLCDSNVLVISPEKLKIERIKKRDQASTEQILARMAKQMTDAEKAEMADYTLINDEKQLLIPQIIELHNLFIKEAKA